MTRDALAALRERIHGDIALARRIDAVPPERFFGEVQNVARELGLDVSEADLRAAADDGARAWLARWTR